MFFEMFLPVEYTTPGDYHVAQKDRVPSAIELSYLSHVSKADVPVAEPSEPLKTKDKKQLEVFRQLNLSYQTPNDVELEGQAKSDLFRLFETDRDYPIKQIVLHIRSMSEKVSIARLEAIYLILPKKFRPITIYKQDPCLKGEEKCDIANIKLIY
ncbi:MAG: hypothetical protein RBS91_08640 [Sulfurimonadaceae bacterium]|jgi:hypothetical protein|nr:hypothetical protein [Sulfurimonadaceae bacterium]